MHEINTESQLMQPGCWSNVGGGLIDINDASSLHKIKEYRATNKTSTRQKRSLHNYMIHKQI